MGEEDDGADTPLSGQCLLRRKKTTNLELNRFSVLLVSVFHAVSCVAFIGSNHPWEHSLLHVSCRLYRDCSSHFQVNLRRQEEDHNKRHLIHPTLQQKRGTTDHERDRGRNACGFDKPSWVRMIAGWVSEISVADPEL
jgi:hypothetical protein